MESNIPGIIKHIRNNIPNFCLLTNSAKLQQVHNLII